MGYCRIPLAFALVMVGTWSHAEEDALKWPFVPLQPTPPPAIGNTAWARNEIDHFVLKRLEEQELSPAPEASRETFIRRVYFDLIGLPPRPEEVASFVKDADPQAAVKLVDRLLEDRRYGERWARFWLDLARYADTAGYEGDPDLPHAWRYRDYVIDAFNNDKPYDLFIREQLAGDEFADILGAGDLPSTPPENVVAMTFLRLAPFTEPRGDETRHELLSEMTSTVGSVFLGLTVGCAKCHDHKYDPIPTRDFYRMQAFFATIQIPRPLPGDGFQIGGPLPAAFYRPGEKEWAGKKRTAFEEVANLADQQLKSLQKELESRLGIQSGFGIQAMGTPFGNDYVFDRQPVNDGKWHYSLITAQQGKWNFFTDGKPAATTGSLSGSNRGHWYGALSNPQHITLGMYTAGSGNPRESGHQGAIAEVLVFDHPLDESERQQLDRYLKGRYRDGPAEPLAIKGIRLHLDAADLDGNPDTPNPALESPVTNWVDTTTGLSLSAPNEKQAPVLQTLPESNQPAVLFSNDFLKGKLEKATFLEDQAGTLAIVYTATNTGEAYGMEVGGDGSMLTTFVNPAAAQKADLAQIISDPQNQQVTDSERQKFAYLSSRKKFLPQSLKRLSPLAMSLRHSYGPPYEPGVPTSRVMIRGEWDNPGEVVEPGFLSFLTGNKKAAEIRLDPFKRWPTRSRRMTLAQWITNPQNPLTARVIVNRLWYRHFGRGIVATPSDFGALGSEPSHPHLLDWLALKLVEQKLSLKAIHRLICQSAAYRQAARIRNEVAHSKDPENTLLWRSRVRRLGAEAVRDSILSVSGRLNAESFGLPIFPPLPNDIANRVKYDTTKWDTQHGPEGRKRSIYIYQQRTLNMPLLQTFDAPVCDESRPKRRSSVTPLQALAMYNGNLVTTELPFFVQRVIDYAGTDVTGQIQHAFQIALSRQPTDEELSRLKEFYAASPTPSEALTSLCRILYNSNEFLYVD